MAHPRWLSAALLTTVFGASPVTAQTIPSPYRYVERGQEANVFGGYLGAGEGRFGFGPAAGPTVGLRYGIDFSGAFSFEGVASVTPTTRAVIDPQLPEGDRLVGEADVRLFFLDARMRFNITGRRTWHGIQPFVTAGGGVATDLAGSQAVDGPLDPADRFDMGTGLTGVLGTGVRIVIAEGVAVRLSADLRLYKIATPDGWLDPELEIPGIVENEWINAGHYTLGVSILF